MKSMINEDIEFSKGLPIPYEVYVTNAVFRAVLMMTSMTLT